MRYLGAQNVATQPLYDTVRLAVVAGGQTVSFFTVPQGGLLAAGVVKGFSHTNLIQAGRLEKGVELTIRAISFFVKDNAGAMVSLVDYLSIFNTSNINLQFAGVSFLRMPVCAVPPSAGDTNYFSNIAPAATEFKLSRGAGTFGNRWILDNPMVLEDQETIQVDLQITGAIAAVTNVTFTLWGDMTRPVR
jgi:hypothetical protein